MTDELCRNKCFLGEKFQPISVKVKTDYYL